MGLKADFDEVKDVWKTTSWRIRLWLALSLFLASGSIASLSETVTKWKGFLLDAVTFYRANISFPAHNLLNDITGLQLPERLPDAFILLGILVSSNTRIVTHRAVNDRSKAVGIATSLGALLLVTGLFFWKGTAVSEKSLFYAVLTVVFYSAVRYWTLGGVARLLWFTYIFSPIVVVAIAAAVNSGLSK